MPARTPALKAMTAAEKGELLDALLTDQPALRDSVEALAVARMSGAHRGAVAEEVQLAVRSLDIDQLNGRAGYRPGFGYVDPGEAADELLDEALQPFLDDLARRGRLGMTTAAAECALGILDGLYRCRAAGSESLLEYTPDYVVERASDVVARCRALGVDLPVDDLVELLPEWDAVLRPLGHVGDGRSGRERARPPSCRPRPGRPRPRPHLQRPFGVLAGAGVPRPDRPPAAAGGTDSVTSTDVLDWDDRARTVRRRRSGRPGVPSLGHESGAGTVRSMPESDCAAKIDDH